MRAYVDAASVEVREATTNSLGSFQTNLDYAYNKYLRSNMLPINLLEGWGGSTKTKGFHQSAFAAEYAMLAIWQHSRPSEEIPDDPTDIREPQQPTTVYDSQVKAEDFIPYKQSSLRLPSVPLFTNDPYFSLWCCRWVQATGSAIY